MNSSQDSGKLVLRLTLGILLLLHGIAKISNGVGFIEPALVRVGLPGAIAYLAYVGEVVAPLALIFGVFTRAAAGVVAINMLFAVGLMHMGQLTEITRTGGWALELQAFFLLNAVVIMLLGAGRYSLGGSGGRYN
ncbi:MAG: DoxX family protein [Candidatus Dactylopiibacterium sp.]|nr:DoxX family protein [Candidatus Dactylopiibacterium sp.]